MATRSSELGPFGVRRRPERSTATDPVLAFLHDEIIPGLAATELFLERALSGEPTAADHARCALSHAIDTIRDRLRGPEPTPRPTPESRAGLDVIAGMLTDLYDLRVDIADLALTGVPEIDDTILAIARELITNAAKHSAGTEVRAATIITDRTVTLTVTDNGVGFSTPQRAAACETGHIGLSLVAERAQRIGGTVDFSDRDERETVVTVSLPRATPAGNERDSPQAPRRARHHSTLPTPQWP